MTDPGRIRAFEPTADLARLGFLETERADAVLSGKWCGFLRADSDARDDFGLAADPDLALLSLERILAAAEGGARDLQRAFERDAAFRRRLVLVLGASAALGEHLVRHPDHWVALTDAGGAAQPPDRDQVVADLRGAVAGRDENSAALALRVAYRRHLLGLAARDLEGSAAFAETTGELADLADGVLAACLDLGRSRLVDGGVVTASDPGRFAVIALGKCGGRELNYVSDVDVVFVADRADEAATTLARTVMRVANAATAEGSIWQVDANLRPEGKSGALVRTPASYLSYYRRWADTWEFQALLKARPAAGDGELGAGFVATTSELVWTAAGRTGFVAEVQAMRRRVEDHVSAGEAEWQLKLGRGGLRDVEFSVQLLQLVHGRSDLLIRSPNTMTALADLAAWGYVGRDDAARMADAYEFLRRLEHRLQLFRLQRTAVVPNDSTSLRRLGRSMGFRRDPAGELLATWRSHARSVRRLHEKLFYRPLLDAVAALPAGEARLSREAAVERLTALGYVDPDGALRNIEALTAGISRRAIIQRTLLPVMLGWFADGPAPDAGLLGFRRVSEALGSTPWYLRLLRDESAVARRMADVLSTSRFASELLLRVPDFVASLGEADELRPRPVGQVFGEMGALISRSENAVERIAAVRSVRRRELLRLAVAEIEGLVGVAELGSAISAITDAAIDRAVEIATREVAGGDGLGPLGDLAVMAVGRLGGWEMGYASDADVMFVFEPKMGADPSEVARRMTAIANLAISLLQGPGPEPALEVDVALRPEGRMGPTVRSLSAYEAYYRRWSAPWEAQALLRARWCAGDRRIGELFAAVIDQWRYPEGGLTGEELREIRRLKARMEAERLPRGTDPAHHLKLGRGGLSDVEWVVQILQLEHAHGYPGLRTTNTLTALEVAVGEGLIEPSDGAVLADAWRSATRIRNAITLVTGRPSNVLPSDPRVVAGVAHVLGYPVADRGLLVENYLRVSRRARNVMERLFYGWE